MSRRAALLGGLGLGAGMLAGCQRENGAGAPPPDLVLTNTPAAAAQPVTVSRNLSAGRYREVDLVIIRPEGVPIEPIPVCVALHAKMSGARSFIDLGVPDMLTQLVRYSSQPFAVVAVDGGNWIGNKDDEPQRMLNEDLPAWLDYNDLANTPFAAIGIGEGGAGALNFVRTPGFAAAAAISPNLYESWGDAADSQDFVDQAQWERLEPLRHVGEYNNLPVGVWCGSDDAKYHGSARAFAERVGAAVKSFGNGGHEAAYWTKVLPEALKFVGGYL